jgi:hypothetical protein
MNPVAVYFNAERFYCSVGLLLGLIFMTVAVYLFIQFKTPFYKGLSYPLAIAGLIFIMICIAVIVRSPKDIKRVNGFIRDNSLKLGTEETPRMEKVIRTFNVLIIAEIILVAAGLLLFLFLPAGSAWRGVGLGLVVTFMCLLLFDLHARSRAQVYLDFLHSLST